MGVGNNTTREALNDKDYKGEDMLVPQNGPIKERKCTDIIFLLIFWSALVAYGGTLVYGWRHNKKD